MVVTPAFKHQDYLIHNVNDMLEIIFESDLRSFENRTLGELVRSPQLRPEVREMFQVQPEALFANSGGSFQNLARRSVLLPLGSDGYVERMITPFYQHDANLAGYVFLFQDMTFEVEGGMIDRVTGLVGKNQLGEALARRIRRIQRYGGQTCRELGVILVRVRGLEKGDGFAEHAGAEALEYVLRKAGQGLKQSVRNAGVVSRSGASTFLVAVPGMGLDRLCQVTQLILERLRGVHVQSSGNLQIDVGAAHQDLPAGCFASGGEREEDLRVLGQELNDRREEARRALHRAGESGPGHAVVYTRSSGYVAL